MFWLVFYLTLLCSCSTASVYYVVPTNASESTHPPCHSLQYYADRQVRYFVTESTFIFLSGEHRLNHGTNITVQNVSNVTLMHTATISVCGDTEEKDGRPVINCDGGESGFIFTNVSHLKIQGINITNCGQRLYNRTHHDNHTNTEHVDIWKAAVALAFVTDFKLVETNITKSIGYGLYGHSVLGTSLIDRCVLTENKGTEFIKCNGSRTCRVHGGNMGMYYNTSCHENTSYFYINNTYITDGYSISYASGLNLILNCPHGGIQLILDKVHLSRNTGNNSKYGSSVGTNLGFQLLAFPNQSPLNRISLNECVIEDGYSYFSSGLLASIYINPPHPQEQTHETEIITVLEINNTKFLNNTSETVGSALHMRLYYAREITKTQVGISLHNCHFENNTLITNQLEQKGGVVVDIMTFKVIENEPHSMPQFKTSFTYCTFENNSLLQHPSLSSGVLYVEEHSNVVLEDCAILNNSCSGIVAVHSYIRFTGHNIIERNQAVYGGGIMLSNNAVMLLTENTTLFIGNNSAAKAGGGIYAAVSSSSAVPLCFFQFDSDTLLNKSRRKSIHVNLQNNTAITGTTVYGGQIDECYFLVDNTPWKNKFLLHQKSGKIFNDTFHYDVHNQTAISSDPVRVCLCENQTANCSSKIKVKNISAGEMFDISAAVVGQRRGNVSGIIIAEFFTPQIHNVSIGKREFSQQVKLSCTSLVYTVFSQRENSSVNLTLHVPESAYSVEYPVITINIDRCPLGFFLNKTGTCECVEPLKSRGIKCNAQNHTIDRPGHFWVGFKTDTNNSKKIIVRYCPRMHCRPNSIEIKAYPDYIDQNSQCNFKRENILCGKCRHGLSIVFGTPRCVKCDHISRWDTFGMVCGFALVGLILVVFLLVCDFTVTKGTLNGFIFYANVVEINQEIYFPLSAHNGEDCPMYRTFRTFIAWLNLDIGAQMCFFNGMTTFEKTWLQFVFPIYIWLITGLLIWLSRKYRHVTRLMKNNGTKVLATLILLSYTKLLRSIMVSLKGVSLDSEDFVWYYDGTVPYFYGRHMVLFLNAAFFTIILLPFTLALLFIKHLPRLTSYRMFHWLNKLKPFFDAYTGPYMDEYRFWVGFQLLIRIFLICATALRTDNDFLLLQVFGLCTLLLNYFYGTRIYKKRSTNVIEASLLLNLIFWSVAAVYFERLNMSTHAAVYVFAGLTFLQFCMVLICYHLYKPACYSYVHAKIGPCLDKATKVTMKCKQRIRGSFGARVEESGSYSEAAHLLPESGVPVQAYAELSEPLSTSKED